MNKLELVNELKKIPNEEAPSFPFDIRELISNYNLINGGNITSIVEQVLVDETLDITIRFKAFYIKLTTLRRFKDYKRYRELFDNYFETFKDFKLMNVFKGNYYFHNSPNRENFLKAKKYFEKGLKDLPNSISLKQNYALLIANSEEEFYNNDSKYLSKAISLIDEAIELTNETYPKYFSTKARLLIKKNDFEYANKYIQLAIENEPYNSNDYPLKMAEYYILQEKIKLSEIMFKIQDKQKTVFNQLESAKAEMMQMMGLLAAIIAFIVTGTQIAREVKIDLAIQLYVLICGSLIVIFSGFSIVFSNKRVSIKQIFILFLGMAIMSFCFLKWH